MRPARKAGRPPKIKAVASGDQQSDAEDPEIGRSTSLNRGNLTGGEVDESAQGGGYQDHAGQLCPRQSAARSR